MNISRKHSLNGERTCTINTKRLAKLLKQNDGVATWNKVLAAYKKFAPKHQFFALFGQTPLTELDLKDLDLSGLTIRQLEFVRCDLSGSNFANSKIGRSVLAVGGGNIRYPVVFDCCDLKDADFDGLLSNHYKGCLDYRLHPHDPFIKVISATDTVQFLKSVSALTGEEREERKAQEKLEEVANSKENEQVPKEILKTTF
jgi:hypothetical protein